jgi:hypothetical protein
MKNLSEMPFTQQMQGKEALIRGIYLSISCDYERLLDDIITKCEVIEPERRELYKMNKVRHLEMGKKLDRCRKALKKYNEFYYKVNEPYFKIIKELLKLRNMLAHGYSDYDENLQDTTFITFNYLENYKPKTKQIEVFSFLMELETYRKSIMEFMQLVIYLAAEVGKE